MLNRTIEWNVKGNTYSVSFPNVGQLVEIEIDKSRFSKNTYGGLMAANTAQSVLALDYIDMYATLKHICPEVIKSIKATSFFELDLADANELLTEYRKVIAPWLIEWQKVLAGRSVEQST